VVWCGACVVWCEACVLCVPGGNVDATGRVVTIGVVVSTDLCVTMLPCVVTSNGSVVTGIWCVVATWGALVAVRVV
jgi:hypothetical protein